VHTADFVYECHHGKLREKADRRLDLADGRSIAIPSERWFEKNGGTPFGYIAELGDQKAQVIEQYGEEGGPSVLADFTNDFLDAVDLHNQSLGCSTTGGAGGVGLAAVGLLALRRRRQRT
jgi:MYXO-CTERM domain-containing protein